MAEKEKVTIMVLKVDLQCHKCYKKVKKVLCKFPQIRDQIYDEKQNQVVIKVVCCSPEKIRDRICCKGGGAIKSIEIREPEKPKPLPADKPKPSAEKPKEPEKPKPASEKPKEPEKPKPAPEKPKEPEKPKPAPEKPKEPEKPKSAPEKPKAPPPNPGPPPVPVNVNAYCVDCYHGHPGGPCQTGYGGVAPYIQYDGYYGRPVYDSYGGGRSCNTDYCVGRSDCFSEENPQGCTVM
ncbi:PREDICTED: myelin-associated oligodendrocyte basic protein-like [Prunus mume]|uniref:Myelin-associated oligodendrocyte basic protein-like n=1 Tax=Prunus mume TaxID=102107 RepID=A0ABM0NGW2_PRUMU|nr:PREDICTED: myelin-associated oligodendrocyte basic protein-like [Prunus mume]